MKNLIVILHTLILFPALVFGTEKDEAYLKEKMIPLAQEFFQRIGQTNTFPLGTNHVRNYKVDYFDDRPGCQADMRLTNDCIFRFLTTKEKTEIWGFQRMIKTYYALESAPKGKIEAVKSLNLQNKLNKETALALAEKYFKQLGHKDENFHPPEISQCYWSGGEDNHGGKLPYYEFRWLRKDVNLADRDNGSTTFPEVLMTVSGIDLGLLHYTRANLPMGSDF